MIVTEFAVNARPETVAAGFRRTLRPWGYLVPPSGLSKKLHSTLVALGAKRIPLIVDNGHFDDITRIASHVEPEVEAITSHNALLEGRLKRTARWSDLRTADRRRRERLASRLATLAGGVEGMSLDEQVSLATSGIIGTEDVTAALWLRAGLDSPAAPAARSTLKQRNISVARQASAILGSLPRSARKQYLPVASAYDYDTAYDAGRAFAGAGLTGASIGFGAFMADNTFSDRIVMRGRERALPRPLPMRYLRTALVARGVWDGWRSVARKSPRRFHFLGLGAPIMLPLVVLAAHETPFLTFDATSPIRDAVEGTLYSSLGAYLKIRTRRLAARLASGQIRSWTCPCGFCRHFIRDHPFNYVQGRRWGKAHTDLEEARPGDLRPGGKLFKAYPLLSEPRTGAIRQAVSYARSGHNHWVISEVIREIQDHRRDFRSLDRYAGRVVASYQESTSSAYFGKAVSLSLDIVRGRFP
jgi:hypothetical protein